MKTKIIGYVVVAKDGAPLSLGSYYSEGPKKILWRGAGFTLFPTRKQAQGARRRSYEHGAFFKSSIWLELKDAQIVPVRLPEGPKEG